MNIYLVERKGMASDETDISTGFVVAAISGRAARRLIVDTPAFEDGCFDWENDIFSSTDHVNTKKIGEASRGIKAGIILQQTIDG